MTSIKSWFLEMPPSFELQVANTFILIVGCVMLGFLMYKGWKREQEAIRRETEALAREEHFKDFRRRVLCHFADAKGYFDQSSVMLEMTKVYADLARANNKEAKIAAEKTKEVVTKNADELHALTTQAQKNADIVKDKTDELKQTIPELTVKKLNESGSDIIKRVKPDGV